MSLLITVEHFATGDLTNGTALALRVPELAELDLTVDQLAIVQALADDMVADMAERTGHHPEECALVIADELVRRHHDEAAYRREAARRGVLAL